MLTQPLPIGPPAAAAELPILTLILQPAFRLLPWAKALPTRTCSCSSPISPVTLRKYNLKLQAYLMESFMILAPAELCFLPLQEFTLCRTVPLLPAFILL